MPCQEEINYRDNLFVNSPENWRHELALKLYGHKIIKATHIILEKMFATKQKKFYLEKQIFKNLYFHIVDDYFFRKKNTSKFFTIFFSFDIRDFFVINVFFMDFR